MQIKKYMLFFIINTVCAAGSLAAPLTDSDIITYFTEGNYTLDKKVSTGSLQECGDGMFTLEGNIENIILGPYHGFSLAPSIRVDNADIPEEKKQHCIYKVSEDAQIKDGKLYLFFEEEKVCKNKSVHILTKTAQVEQGLIILNSLQTGENPTRFSCQWTLKKSKTIKK
ncbi:MAG: hypothetical protein H6623_06970 [Bdellovibrionaceae bacterium]|nr:hypothetical protein [Pseudobdellovibrionaceae bacterium]